MIFFDKPNWRFNLFIITLIVYVLSLVMGQWFAAIMSVVVSWGCYVFGARYHALKDKEKNSKT